jgi:predicted aspartyl protease
VSISKFPYVLSPGIPDVPYVSIELLEPDNSDNNIILDRVLLDTGACITVIPLEVLADLNCKQTGTREITLFNEDILEVDMYLVVVNFCNHPIERQVAASDKGIALLGRDFLNKRRVEFDGAKSMLTVHPLGGS